MKTVAEFLFGEVNPDKKTCEHGHHQWGKWVITERYDVQRKSDKAILGKGFYQERECSACGKKQLDEQRTSKGA